MESRSAHGPKSCGFTLSREAAVRKGQKGRSLRLRLGWQLADAAWPDRLAGIGAVNRRETEGQAAQIITGGIKRLALFLDCAEQLAHGALEPIFKPGS